MKRWLLILLAALLICSFVACDEENEQPSETEESEQPSETEEGESTEESKSNTERVKALSGSMSPTIDVGEWVEYVPVTSPDTLQVGDIIVFEDANGMLIIRRIVAISHNSNGELQFTTRGDANPVVDPDPIPGSGVRGLVTSHS